MDQATLTTKALRIFDEKWADKSSRLEIVAGKSVLRAVRDRFQRDYDITLTDLRIVDCYKAEEVPRDLVELIQRVDAFRDGQETS